MDTQDRNIKNELLAVGVSRKALLTPEAKQLYNIIESDEEIGGAIYGRYSDSLAWLVATNKRIIFLDKKPFFTSTDEFTYDVMTGVRLNRAGLSASVTLHTRMGDYVIRFVNKKSARIFINYLETRRIESTMSADRSSDNHQVPTSHFDKEALNFLKQHDTGVLSTIDRGGNVHGAVVYYAVDQNNLVYILTKSDTGKAHNIHAHSQVAFTIHEPGTLQTLQLQGIAEIESNQATKDMVFTRMVQIRQYRDQQSLPPVTKLHEGSFTVLCIIPNIMSYHDYANTE